MGDKKVAVQLRVRVADMGEPSDDEDDEEEIQCLVEEPVKKVLPPKVVSSPDPKPYKPTPSPYNEEAPVKRSTAGATKSEEKPVEEPPKPSATGIALPITEMTDNWMDDGQALGSMDSEDEEEPKEAVAEEKAVSDKKPAESKTAEPNQNLHQKQSLLVLPFQHQR